VSNFRALVLHEEGGKVVPRLETVDESRLPAGEVTVAVEYSTLNYKDGMILEGQGRLVRTYPHVPGVDFAGTVLASDSPEFRPGDPVILTGWRVGELHWGGYAERARVPAGFLVRRPDGLSARQAMAIGTAGFTAMLAIMALEKHGLVADAGSGANPGANDVIVTGAAGGVGSIAISVLSKLGYRVAASTGRPELREYLEGLGAAELIDRAALAAKPTRPLDRERWAGAIDAVGGMTLATVLTQLKYRASVAACGLAGGSDLAASVIPFLLRGVNLLGIDSVMCPREERIEAWRRLARDLPLDKLETLTQTVPLADVPGLAPRILKGEVRGRIVVEIAGDLAA
jgi:acrylyl-CoA reductase (NADPH)